MKQRSRLLSAGIGAAMLVGSLFTFTGTAHATIGDLAVTPVSSITIGSMPPIVTNVTGIGAGTLPNGARTSPRNGNLTLTGNSACIAVSVVVGGANDIISWDAFDTGTETMANAVITVDSTGCGTPPISVCRITLNSTKTLSTAVGGFPESGGPNPPNPYYRIGTFTQAPGTQIGNYTITDPRAAPNNTCLSSGLAATITGTFGNPTPAALPYTNNSTAPFSASLNKTLEVG